jgi:hypothetical protein
MMEELGRLPVSEVLEKTSSVILAFGNDEDDDDPPEAPMVPVCAAVAFL